MVKSNGYGHGMTIAARAALDGGATWLGVYTPQEATGLRAAGFGARILVVGWSPPPALESLIASGVDISVLDAEGVRAVASAAGGRRPRIHLKIDTGLHRLGALPETLDSLAGAVREAGDRRGGGRDLHPLRRCGRGCWSSPSRSTEFSSMRSRRCEGSPRMRCCTRRAARRSWRTRRCITTSCAWASPSTAIRPCPGPHRCGPRCTSSAVSRRCESSPPERASATGGPGVPSTARRIATVTLGYGQGVPRALSNRGHMAIRGKRCPIVGIVSMDQVGLDVSDVSGVEAGDAAMFIGERGGVRIGADEVGDLSGHAAARDSVRHLRGHPTPSWGHARCATVRV